MAASRAVRIVTEVGAVDRPFDYALGDATAHVGAGDRVRVDFNHRSVRGWVVGEATPSDDLKVLSKWLGFGPPPRLLELLAWASERWCAPLSRFLVQASPKRLVTSLTDAPTAEPLSQGVARELTPCVAGVWQVAPTTDPLAMVLGAYETCRHAPGSLLVLVPTESWALRLRGRLEQRGCAVASGETQWDRMRSGWPVIVGSRGGALAPAPRLSGAIILDADDEAYRSESAPTWGAVALVRERCRRDEAPLWCTTMIPSPALLDGGDYQRGADLAGGWPRVDVVDRRRTDPHEGTLSQAAVTAAHRALGGDEPVAVAVVLQRLGAGRLFACRSCGELARCAVCGGGEVEDGAGLACREHHEPRENFCRSCGATNLKKVRVGVTTLARDVAMQLAQPVTEVTSLSPLEGTVERVVVGTEAIWQRVRRCAVVVFVDFDQYLLAPRESARRAAITAVGKAGRLVGPRRDARGRVIVQTRRGDDPVVTALTTGRFDDIVAEDVETAKVLHLSPYGARCTVSGEGADEYVARLAAFDVTVHATSSGYEVRARGATTLTGALRAAGRPLTRLRIAVE